MTTPRETELSRSIKDALEKHNFWVLRIQSGKIQTKHGSWVQLCPEGTPDLLVIVPLEKGAEYVWLEVKTPVGTVNEAQSAWHARAAKLGVKVHVVRSVSDALAAVGKVAK